MDILESGMSGKSSNIKENSKVSGSAGAGEFLVAAIVYTGKFRDLITGGNRNICSLLEAIGCAIELIDGLELLGCCNQERIFRRTGAAVKERNDFIFVIFELLCRIACGDKVGACKLSLNVKNGVIEEALVETIGCSGMTHSAAMAAEILQGKTILEALNTDLVCDAINTAMRELFLQIVYGRTQSAFSDDGLAVGAGLEDLGKGLRSQVGTMYATKAKGVRYLEMAEGYVTGIALDKNDEVIGYQFVSLGKMTDFIKKGDDANTAWEKASGSYGRVTPEQGAVKIIDPRQE